MPDFVKRLSATIDPDATRTVIRPFDFGDPESFVVKNHPRSERVVNRVKDLDDATVARELKTVHDALDDRHGDVDQRMMRRFKDLESVLGGETVSDDRAVLIGAYFSEEFSFESAALFNPSAVEHPDQSGVEAGATRFVCSLRGIGEGHVSSLAFRTGVWKADGDVELDPPPERAMGPIIEPETGKNGELIAHLHCGGAKTIQENVIFPFLPSQGRGIEDVRLVRFTEDDGAVDFRGTATAFNGSDVRQALLRTADFMEFEFRGVQGSMYSGKGMALFPRRIDGRFVMLGRQDNENIWLLSSEEPFTWDGGAKIVSPRYPWEFVQIGNCGSPIELDEGWLVLTHGVGVVRNYSVGACLLDKADPSKLLARLPTPLLEPTDRARDGYVPNVVYSCGGFVRGRTLLLPYGEADNFAAFATVDVDRLLAAME